MKIFIIIFVHLFDNSKLNYEARYDWREEQRLKDRTTAMQLITEEMVLTVGC